MAAPLQKIVAEYVTKRDYGMPGDDAASDALDVIATNMAANFDVGELLEDLYGGGYMAGALDRLVCGRAAQFGDEGLLRALLRRLRALESQVESEMNS